MSTNSKPKGAPAHQNKFAFKHNKHSKLTEKIQQLPNRGLCQHCHDKVEWRKQYRKYKPLTAPTKCSSCHNKAVRYAYHTICEKCSIAQDCCAWCCKKGVEIVNRWETEEEKQERVDFNNSVRNMKERERRTLFRKMEKEKEAAKEAKKRAALGLPPESEEEGSEMDASGDEAVQNTSAVPELVSDDSDA